MAVVLNVQNFGNFIIFALLFEMVLTLEVLMVCNYELGECVILPKNEFQSRNSCTP